MSLPQIYFGRQELALRAGIDEDQIRYWIRAGALKAEHGGGGKGQHLRFTRLELGLAVVLARLRKLGLSSAALAALADHFHAAVDWMRDKRLDAEQASEVDELVQARSRLPNAEGAAWQGLLQEKEADPWFDLPPSAIRLAGSVSPEEWHAHHGLFRLLVSVALTRPTGSRRPARLARDDNGEWRLLAPSDVADCVEIDLDALAEQLWSHER